VRVRFGIFTLDVDARQLARAGTPLHLSPKAFDVLTTLVEQRPAVVEKAALRQRLWPDVHVVDAALTNLVAEIRGVLREGTDDSTFVRTVHGVGYAFAGEASDEAGARAPETSRATPFWLVWKDRPIVLSPGDHVVGRDAACAVWLDEDGVSRRHARIRVPAGGEPRVVTIEDLSSTNGTYVQGHRTTGETDLESGDRIQMGHATLVFRAWKVADAPTKRVKVPARGKGKRD
jgi:DNA-binding winged helix-turn-helix (wHTH) protein